MAAKANVFHVGTRILCILIFIPLVKGTTTESSIANNTATTIDVTNASTEATTTTESTTVTTTQVQTTVPATTTPPILTFAPSNTPVNVDIGQCWCDVTGNACDVGCCCDNDCTREDIAAFTQCLPAPVNLDNRMCVQSSIILTENSALTSETTQDGLFCIYTDNNKDRNFYNVPDIVNNQETFNAYVERYSKYTYSPTTSAAISYSQFYKVGDPIFVVYNTSATAYLNIPQGMPYCSDYNPVSYLRDQSFSCTRQLQTLDSTTCQSAYFKASSYLNNVRVVKTPYLFTWIVNGTEVTTPAPTTSTTTTPNVPTTAATTSNDTNVTTVETSTTVTTTTTTVPTTTVVITTESPVERSLYNNTYTTELEVESVECRNLSGSVINCPFNLTSIPDPSYSAPVCDNVVLAVEYHLTQDGSNGITQAGVRLTIGAIAQNDLPVTQTFSSSFSSINEVNKTIVDRSGNPGYIIGKPVRAGILVQNTTGDNRYAVVESMYDLSIVRSSATGTCLTDAANRQQINFGLNMVSGCLIRFNLNNITALNYCNAMQEFIVDALEGVIDGVRRDDPERLRRVATFGNSDPQIAGDWVQILRTGPPSNAGASRDSQEGPVCSLSMGLHTEILYANAGALANPQSKIVGVSFKYEETQDIVYTCVGTRCTPGNTDVDQTYEVRHSVTFIDTSQPATAYVGEPPIFLAKVPYDFFYPFVSSSVRGLTYHFNLILITLISVILYHLCVL